MPRVATIDLESRYKPREQTLLCFRLHGARREVVLPTYELIARNERNLARNAPYALCVCGHACTCRRTYA